MYIIWFIRPTALVNEWLITQVCMTCTVQVGKHLTHDVVVSGSVSAIIANYTVIMFWEYFALVLLTGLTTRVQIHIWSFQKLLWIMELVGFFDKKLIFVLLKLLVFLFIVNCVFINNKFCEFCEDFLCLFDLSIICSYT